MTKFRVRAVDGSARAVTADRVVVADAELRLQPPGTTGWVTVESAPLAEVARVERRFTEADGRELATAGQPTVSQAGRVLRRRLRSARVMSAARW